MKKWNRGLILLLVLILSASVLGGCSKDEESFAPRKAPDGISQKVYDSMAMVVNDASKIKDDFNEKFPTYKDSDEYQESLLAWYDNLYEHELIKKYTEDEDSLNETEGELLHMVELLHRSVLLYHGGKGDDPSEEFAETDKELVMAGIEELKNIVDIDIKVEDFIK